ncbi:hypothetical protein ACA350_04375 [Orientia tsutsugamushi]
MNNDDLAWRLYSAAKYNNVEDVERILAQDNAVTLSIQYLVVMMYLV